MARRKKTEKRELSHEDIPRNTRATAWRLLGRMARQWWKLLLVAGAALLSSASFTAIPWRLEWASTGWWTPSGPLTAPPAWWRPPPEPWGCPCCWWLPRRCSAA
ncbi:MAG: hypothetical protein ACLRIS_04015 [Flavonifractor plautii]